MFENTNGIAARTPLNTMPGLGWPSVPGRIDAAILAILYQLENTQWWSPERLLSHQLQQFQLLVAHAARTVPFYADRLAAVSLLDPGQLDIGVFRRIPLTLREEAQRAGDALLSTDPPQSHGKAQTMTTSGSTGRPMEIHRGQAPGLYHQANTLRYHKWHRRDFSKDTLLIRTVTDPKRLEKPHSWAPCYRTGPQTMLDINRPIPDLFEELIKADPTYLQTHPSTLEALIRMSRQTDRMPTRLVEVRTFGEVLEPSLRKLCREVWGVPVADNYAAEEFGMLAVQCPEHEHLHVQSENVIVEVLNDDGRPCAPGETGRVFVTGLHNFLQPLIRYDTGDLAELGGPCPCGRGLPVLKRVLGRVRNLAVLPDGTRRHPVFDEALILAAAPVQQFQLVQKNPAQIDLRLVVPRELTAEEETALTAAFNDGIGHRFNYRFEYVDDIPRTDRGKFEIFRCEVERVPEPA